MCALHLRACVRACVCVSICVCGVDAYIKGMSCYRQVMAVSLQCSLSVCVCVCLCARVRTCARVSPRVSVFSSSNAVSGVVTQG